MSKSVWQGLNAPETLKIEGGILMKNRLKSIPLWSSVLALIYLICVNCLGIELAAWAEISTQILAILTVLFGVANNPTDHQNF